MRNLFRLGETFTKRNYAAFRDVISGFSELFGNVEVSSGVRKNMGAVFSYVSQPVPISVKTHCLSDLLAQRCLQPSRECVCLSAALLRRSITPTKVTSCRHSRTPSGVQRCFCRSRLASRRRGDRFHQELCSKVRLTAAIASRLYQARSYTESSLEGRRRYALVCKGQVVALPLVGGVISRLW